MTGTTATARPTAGSTALDPVPAAGHPLRPGGVPAAPLGTIVAVLLGRSDVG